MSSVDTWDSPTARLLAVKIGLLLFPGMGRDPKVWLKEGDEVTISIEGIGDLTNKVSLEKPPSAL